MVTLLERQGLYNHAFEYSLATPTVGGVMSARE